MALRAVTERMQGDQPSRVRAFMTAATAGAAVGVLVYKLLRSGEEQS
jgi:hypothetical protein